LAQKLATRWLTTARPNRPRRSTPQSTTADYSGLSMTELHAAAKTAGVASFGRKRADIEAELSRG
jgi:hypothetical protein